MKRYNLGPEMEPSRDADPKRFHHTQQNVSWPPPPPHHQLERQQQRRFSPGHQEVYAYPEQFLHHQPQAVEHPPVAWTEEEDAVLREGVLRFGTRAWAKVATHLLPPVQGGRRTPGDCSARWEAVVRHTAVKGPWLPEEDALLRQLVHKFGPKRWALIASHIPGRAGKQCRERWLNHLDTRVIKSDWTPEEDVRLLEAQQRLGNKWSEIARSLPGRAENAVKNRFNSLITKRLATSPSSSSSEGTPSSPQQQGVVVPGPTPPPPQQHGQVLPPQQHGQVLPLAQSGGGVPHGQVVAQYQQHAPPQHPQHVPHQRAPLCPQQQQHAQQRPQHAQQRPQHVQQLQHQRHVPQHPAPQQSSSPRPPDRSPHQEREDRLPEQANPPNQPSSEESSPTQTTDETKDKSPMELLSLMYRRIGESEHVATKIGADVVQMRRPQRQDDVGASGDFSRSTPASRKLSLSERKIVPAQKNTLEAELQSMNLARRFWCQERERSDLFDRVAFSADEWDRLEARATRHAAANPDDAAATAAAAATAIGDACGAPTTAPTPHQCASPTSRRRGLERTGAPENSKEALHLSGGLCSLSLDDPTWLTDVVDLNLSSHGGALFNERNGQRRKRGGTGYPSGGGDGAVKLSWNGLPGTARSLTRQLDPVFTKSIEDWGHQMMLAPSPAPESPRHDTSMSLDNVDWDLILKMSNPHRDDLFSESPAFDQSPRFPRHQRAASRDVARPSASEQVASSRK